MVEIEKKISSIKIKREEYNLFIYIIVFIRVKKTNTRDVHDVNAGMLVAVDT